MGFSFLSVFPGKRPWRAGRVGPLGSAKAFGQPHPAPHNAGSMTHQSEPSTSTADANPEIYVGNGE
jgi:hypothetical protein